jgi:LuxR family transcriptional regulator, maltose regulon positive regulatory protein
MSEQILLTKLFVPSPRVNLVPRHRLIERLNNSLVTGCKLTLISAPAGFGKSTLVCDWLRSINIPIAWLTLDERDKDPARFLAYLAAALQNVQPGIGLALQAILQSPQPLQIENILTLLINEIALIAEDFLVVLDDYHAVDSAQVDQCLDFLIDHQPPRMHLVIATREDPDLPLAHLRARGHCIELRAADLQFTPAEVSEFLNQGMRLNLSDGDVAALETRTEGWIAGLQMAAISMQGLQDIEGFIQSFTGSHRFVMDYLLEEVLSRQPENIQAFLQKTSILDRMCGSLCDALLENPSIPGQSILEYLDHANLFIIPLDNERCWFRYHHLFASLLRKRLGQSLAPEGINRLHNHASEWYENNDLILEAFRHAAAANDIERAMRLMESSKMPLHLRGTVSTILEWLMTLPVTILNAQPALWWKQAEMLLLSGQMSEVEERLLACEAALDAASLPAAGLDDTTRNIIGEIAALRSNLAIAQQNAETILVQAHHALEYLLPENLAFRASVVRDIGFANNLLGNRTEARQNFTESLSLAKASGDMVEPLLSTIGLAQIHERENQLYLADECYQRIQPTIGDYSILNAGVVYLGKARICYEWNDLDTAEKYGEQSLQLAQQFSQIIHRSIMSEVFLARLQLAQGDLSRATALLSHAEQIARQHNFHNRMSEITAVKVLLLLRQGDLKAAAQLAHQYDLSMSKARVLLVHKNPCAALAVLETLHRQIVAKGWVDEQLKVLVLKTIALYANREKDQAVRLLGETLTLAEPGGFIRLFLDEGAPMAQLLHEAKSHGLMPDYTGKLLAAFEAEKRWGQSRPDLSPTKPLIDPLSPREIEILKLITQGLSNREIGERLFLALDTVKGHNRRIFEKLQVQRRTEAIARARELGLI